MLFMLRGGWSSGWGWGLTLHSHVTYEWIRANSYLYQYCRFIGINTIEKFGNRIIDRSILTNQPKYVRVNVWSAYCFTSYLWDGLQSPHWLSLETVILSLVIQLQPLVWSNHKGCNSTSKLVTSHPLIGRYYIPCICNHLQWFQLWTKSHLWPSVAQLPWGHGITNGYFRRYLNVWSYATSKSTVPDLISIWSATTLSYLLDLNGDIRKRRPTHL